MPWSNSQSCQGRLGVQGIPTLVLFNNGTEIARQVGALPADRLHHWLNGAISANQH